MNKLLLIIILLLSLLVALSAAFAQGMMGGWTSSPSFVSSDDHTAQEEAEGKEVWEKLQSKQLECKNLIDENYGSLGEYFMGQMAGSSHKAMNNMMIQMMGEQSEEQMHVAMGKRLSGCDTSAIFPQSGVGFMPMMWMMGSAGSPQVRGGGNPMMGYGSWSGFGLGWIFMIIFWVLIILGVVALVRYLGGTKQNSTDKDKTPLDILKERYVKGEIDKKEFEEKKKDLG